MSNNAVLKALTLALMWSLLFNFLAQILSGDFANQGDINIFAP